MFCPKCGNEINPGAKFCGKCGNALNVGGQERAKSPSGDSSAGKKFRGMKMPEGMKVPDSDEIKDSLRKASADVAKTTEKLGLKLQKWLSGYVDKWRNLGQMKGRDKWLWLGIHGGTALLLAVLLIVSVGGKEQEEEPAVSGGGKDKLNAKALCEELVEDGKLTSEEQIYVAGKIHSYADWENWKNAYDNSDKIKEAVDFADYYNFAFYVEQQCRNMSAMGALTKKYYEWYDKDGLFGKLFDCSDQATYIVFSGGDMRADNSINGNNVTVSWYAFPDSDEVVFMRSTRNGEEATSEEYCGRFEGSDAEFVITLDGKEYHFSEAGTALFKNIAKETWEYNQEFYNMIAANLGGWEKLSNPYNDPPLYISYDGSTMTVRGVDGIFLENIKVTYEQGKGKTVTLILDRNKSVRLEASYDKVDGNLVFTVQGKDYVLSPTTIKKTGTYDEWGNRKK